MSKHQLGIIWDVDGTLVDTAQLHLDAWIRLANEMGREFSKQDFANTFGRRNPEIIEYLFQRSFTPQEIHEIGERKEGYYRTEAQKGIDLLPGVRKFLEHFHELKIPQTIGSSAPRENVAMIMKITESAHFFRDFVGMEDTANGKPHPEVFLTAAQKLGIPPEKCIVFEDAIAGVQAAKAGGMYCVGVTFVGHHSAEKLLAAGADRVVRSFDEISPEEALSLVR